MPKKNDELTTNVTTQSPPSSQPAITSTPGYRQEDVYDRDGKRWRDKFAGLTGAIEQTRGALEVEKSELQKQIDALNAEVANRDSTIGDLNKQVQDAATRLETVPALQQQIEELTQKAAMADKLRVIAKHPDLLKLQVKQEVPVEGGDPVIQTINPLLNLIESSSLEGDALEAQIAHLATLYQPAPAETKQVSQPIAPAPAAPTDQYGNVEYWRKVADEARQAMNAGDMTAQTRLQLREAWQKIRELEIAAA